MERHQHLPSHRSATGPESPDRRISPDTQGPSQTSGAAGPNPMLDAGRATISNSPEQVTWAFSFTYAEVRAGDSASQIRHEPSDQNWMIWRDVALQHFGSTVFGLWLLLMAIVPANHIPTH